MPTTPSRRAREQLNESALREEGRLANEIKFTEFQLGCEAGEAHACTSLGEWYSVMRNDFVRAAELYTQACVEKHYPQACLSLGMILGEIKIFTFCYANNFSGLLLTPSHPLKPETHHSPALAAGGRPGVPPSTPQAIEVLSIGCTGGNGDACAESGKLLLRGSGGGGPAAAPPNSKAVARAESLLRTGCTAGSGTSHSKCCGLLAALHLSPALAPSAPAPPPRAEELVGWLERACRGEHAPSCMKLAEGYRSESCGRLGLPRDEALARSLEVTGLQWSGLSPAQAARTVEKKHGKPPTQSPPG